MRSDSINVLTQGLPLQLLDASVVRFLKKAKPAPWCVAVSGGADSVCLLLLLWAYFEQARKTMTILHVDHGLRGQASEEDAIWVQALAQELGLDCNVSKGLLDGTAKKTTEEAARRMRYACFQQHMERLGAKYLFLGHQAQDVAENFLLRLGRGSGLSGLCGTRPVQPMPGHWRLRPLLNINPDTLRKSLTQAGIQWREDGSNAEGIFLRNRLRHEVIPRWEAALGQERSLLKGVLRSRRLLEEADIALASFLESSGVDLQQAQLNTEALKKTPKACVRRGLEQWLWLHLPQQSLNASAVETLLEAVLHKKNFRMSAGKHGFLILKRGALVYVNA